MYSLSKEQEAKLFPFSLILSVGHPPPHIGNTGQLTHSLLSNAEKENAHSANFERDTFCFRRLPFLFP